MTRQKQEARANPSQWYTAREAAQYFDVTKETIKRWLKKGRIKGQLRSFQGDKRRWEFEGKEINRRQDELKRATVPEE